MRTGHDAPEARGLLLPRRRLLARAGAGCGMLGLAGLLHDEQARAGAGPTTGGGPAENPLAPRSGH
ncbi:MAG: DUF1501 domain-containing protein, partial [Planctomycetia bacterium]